MTTRKSRTASALAAGTVAALSLATSTSVSASPPAPPVPAALHPAAQPQQRCTVDLALPGAMSDVLSNALTRGLKLPPREVGAFLADATGRYKSGPDLVKAAAAHFHINEDALAAKVERYKHCNCSHPVESRLHPALRVDPAPHADCTIDLELAGMMGDVLSNALTREFMVPEPGVRAFLNDADDKYEDGPAVFNAVAEHFRIDENVLAAAAQKYRHCNCENAAKAGTSRAAPAPDDGAPIPPFAKDVTLHVVLHELGHALIREFDIPVLGNEETVADAFATYYLTTHAPDRALDALTARVTSLMIEAGEEPTVKWSGEHDHDARRAYQIAALAVAADPVKYRPVADIVAMSEADVKKAVDYGGEIRRSWRRVLAPLWMPEGLPSPEARVQFDASNPFLNRVCADGLARELEEAVRRFDWHSQVTIKFVDDQGGAGWNRSQRTVTVHGEYIRRFIKQSAVARATKAAPAR